MFRFGPYQLNDRLGSSVPSSSFPCPISAVLFYQMLVGESCHTRVGRHCTRTKDGQQSLVIYDDLIHWIPNAPIILLLLLLSLNGTDDRICVMEDLRCEQEIDNKPYETTIAAITVFSSLNY